MLLFSRILRLLAGILVAFILYLVVRDVRLLDCRSLQAWMENWGLFAPLAFSLVYGLATLGFFPGVLLTLVAGMIFGVYWGTLLVVATSTLTATLVFLAARHIGHDAVNKRFSSKSWFQRFRSEVEEHSIRYMIFVRLIPIFPYSGINLASALTSIKVRDFVIGSLIGMIPGTFAFVYIGETGCILADPISRGELGLDSIPFDVLLTQGLVVLLLAALAIAPIVLRRLQRKEKEKLPDETRQ